MSIGEIRLQEEIHFSMLITDTTLQRTHKERREQKGTKKGWFDRKRPFQEKMRNKKRGETGTKGERTSTHWNMSSTMKHRPHL